MSDARRESSGSDVPDGSICCKVDFNLDDKPASMGAFLPRIQPILVAPPGSSWELDLRRCRYMGPDAAAVILSTVLAGRALNQNCTVLLPETPKELDAFCHFSGLKHHLFGEPMPDVEHPACETSPLDVQRRADWLQSPTPFVRLIRKHVDMSEEAEESLRICINESLQNVEDHAQSPIGAVTCARYLARYRQIRLAVVDRGAGILKTLRRKFSDTQDARHALQRVVEGRFSSMSRPSNMGLGISNLAMIVKRMMGTVIILTGDTMALFSRSQWTYPSGKYDFPGTGLFLTMPVVDRV